MQATFASDRSKLLFSILGGSLFLYGMSQRDTHQNRARAASILGGALVASPWLGTLISRSKGSSAHSEFLANPIAPMDRSESQPGSKDIVEEASWESFPASDPPAW